MTLAGEYHRYREHAYITRKETFRVVTKPGILNWNRLDPGTRLLVEKMVIGPTDAVLDLGCGYGIVGLAAAKMAVQGQVHLVDSNVVAVEAARRTLALNDLSNAQVHLSDGAATLPAIAFDVVAAHLPRSKALARQFIVNAANALKPGGRFYLAGHKKTGVKSSVSYAQEVFGNSEVLAFKKGYRLVVCTKDADTTIPQTNYHHWHKFSVQVRDQNYSFISKPGVFSWDSLDAGSRVLVETMKIRPADRVLDLGCGCGIVGLAAAKMAVQGQVYLVDSNAIAVEAARRTLSLNSVINAQVHLSDSAAAVQEIAFDIVVTNPPFHQGRQTDYNIAHQFIRDAAAVLKRGGCLYVVANSFIRYEREMSKYFHEVNIVHKDNLYRVLLGKRPKKRDGLL